MKNQRDLMNLIRNSLLHGRVSADELAEINAAMHAFSRDLHASAQRLDIRFVDPQQRSARPPPQEEPDPMDKEPAKSPIPTFGNPFWGDDYPPRE